jgi:uncharacterized protein YbjT (DUF2867 family)
VALVILVTGATGRTGRHVVSALLRRRAPVRVLARDPAKAREAREGGAEVVPGDFDDPKSLARALAGVEAAFLLLPPDPALAERQARFLEEARRAGVGRVVRYSALGSDPASRVPLLRWHGEGERALERAGLGWAHVRPNFFLQNLLGRADAIRTGVLPLALGNARVSMVDCRDAAEVSAHALLDPKASRVAYDVTGPESLSGEDAAARLSTALGRPVRYRDLPPERFREDLAAAGLPDWLGDAIALLFDWLREGRAAATTDAVLRRTGEPARDLVRFARDHASALAPALA